MWPSRCGFEPRHAPHWWVAQLVGRRSVKSDAAGSNHAPPAGTITRVTVVNRESLAPVRAALRELGDAGQLTTERATEVVQRWLEQHLPQLPKPVVHVRAFRCPDSGRIYARATITVLPLCVDALVSASEE